MKNTLRKIYLLYKRFLIKFYDSRAEKEFQMRQKTYLVWPFYLNLVMFIYFTFYNISQLLEKRCTSKYVIYLYINAPMSILGLLILWRRNWGTYHYYYLNLVMINFTFKCCVFYFIPCSIWKERIGPLLATTTNHFFFSAMGFNWLFLTILYFFTLNYSMIELGDMKLNSFFIIFVFMTSMTVIIQKIVRDTFQKNFKLKRHLAQFKKILKEKIKDPIFVIDPHTKEILFVNDDGEVIKNSSVLGQDFKSYLNDLSIECKCEGVMHYQKIENEEIELISYSNKFYYAISATEYTWEENQNTILVVMKNITYYKLYSKNLEENGQFKDLMISTVSHDIRTPLNCSMTVTKICLEKTDDEFIKKNLEYSLKSSELLLSIVNDLLDYSQINVKKFKIVVSKYFNREVFKDLNNLFGFMMKEKNIEFILDDHTDKDMEINSDKDRIERILINLISNALKFTRTGFIKVSSRLIFPSYIEYSVEDSGIGIKEEDQHKLFKLYGKAEEESTYNQHGVGLGLTISNMISCCLNEKPVDERTINLESEYGKGSKFTFKVKNFPVEPLPNVPVTNSFSSFGHQTRFIQSTPAIIQREVKLEPKEEILVIEDEETNLFAMKNLLEMLEKPYSCCYNGKEAQELIKSECEDGKFFPLIISDINMPIMNGFQFINWLRGFQVVQRMKGIRVIACSANVSNKDKDLYNENGFDSYLEKPINLKKMRELLDEKDKKS